MKNKLKKALQDARLEFEDIGIQLKVGDNRVWLNRSGKLTIQHKYKQVSYDDIDEGLAILKQMQ